jgi:hypothetical protein
VLAELGAVYASVLARVALVDHIIEDPCYGERAEESQWFCRFKYVLRREPCCMKEGGAGSRSQSGLSVLGRGVTVHLIPGSPNLAIRSLWHRFP